jgi:hypothetical protein
LTGTPPVSSEISTLPHPAVPVAEKPKLPIIRGPIVNGSSSLPGANDIGSSVSGVAKKATQAITGGINSVTSVAKNALSGAGLKSPTNSSESATSNP